jgi:Hom_end-associated Hint/Homing endonuclease
MAKEGKFNLEKKTAFSELASGSVTQLPESDLCFQDGENIYQFKFTKDEDHSKLEIKPGIFVLVNTQSGLDAKSLEFKQRSLLESVTNTSKIIGEARKFFNRLDVYERLNRIKKRGVLLYSKPGLGKCLHPDTPVLMFDGSTKTAKEIKVGDKLMGPDSKPRNVLGTTFGKDTMYEIQPTKGESYIVNSAHILSLRSTDTQKIVNINVKEYLALPKWKQERLKGWRSDLVHFSNQKEPVMDPRLLGMWLGDGTSVKPEICTADKELADYIKDQAKKMNLLLDSSKVNGKALTYRFTSGKAHGKRGRNEFVNQLKKLNVLGNKHIPLEYKTGDISTRLRILAGLIDTDGSYCDGVFDYTSKSKTLAEDVAFIARSLGLAAYIKDSYKCATNSKKKNKQLYYRVCISGDIDCIPTLLPRKQASERLQIKNVRNVGIKVKKLKNGEYSGFELDGDHLFLLGDFTVTHNTSAIEKVCLDLTKEDPGTVVFVWPTSKVDAEDITKFLSISSVYAAECTRLILVIEDIGGGEIEGRPGRSGVDSGLLNLLDGVGVVFKLPTFIIATTNHPENLLSSLADRPGRFDLMLKLQPPSHEERIALMSFICKRDLSDEEKECLASKGAEDFSIAHLEEIAVRAELDDKTHAQVVKELVQHKELFNRDFEDRERKMGSGFSFFDED